MMTFKCKKTDKTWNITLKNIYYFKKKLMFCPYFVAQGTKKCEKTHEVHDEDDFI